MGMRTLLQFFPCLMSGRVFRVLSLFTLFAFLTKNQSDVRFDEMSDKTYQISVSESVTKGSSRDAGVSKNQQFVLGKSKTYFQESSSM